MPIYEKIQKIQDNLPRLRKDGEFGDNSGSGPNYKFLAVDDVIKGLRPLLAEHQVVVVPNVVDVNVEHFAGEATGPRPPRVNSRTYLTVDYKFLDSEDGSSETIRVVGEASDTSDKGVRKAMTSAQKIAFIQMFTIETGEPDEHELGGSEPEPEEKEPAALKVAKASVKPTTSKPQAAATSGLRARVKAEVIDAKRATAAQVKEKTDELKAEFGVSKANDEIYQILLDTDWENHR